jgi:hypothetical protein
LRWILVFIRAMAGGRGLPHAPALGVGVGSGFGAGVGVGAGLGLAVGLGVGVPARGIFGIGTVRIGDAGDAGDAGVPVGCVGNSSVIM